MEKKKSKKEPEKSREQQKLFQPKQMLEALPGLTYDRLHYFEKMDFIHPKKVKQGRLEKRLYSKDDYEKLKFLWKYYKEGFPPKVCNQKAETQLGQQKQKSLVYESPESNDGKTDTEQKNRMQQLIKNNPVLRLVAQTLSDSRIPQKDREDMEKQIASFVGWLRDKTSIRSGGQWPGVVRALATTKNGHINEHSRFVLEQAPLLAEKIGLKEEIIKRVRIVAILHDVGKYTISTLNDVLEGSTSLTREKKSARECAKTKVKITKYVNELEEVIPIVKATHERWDGKGYPDGLAGDRIPLEARIIAIVDTYWALISDRPYRKRFSRQEAIKKLQDEAGKQFDPKLVQAFVEEILRLN